MNPEQDRQVERSIVGTWRLYSFESEDQATGSVAPFSAKERRGG